MTSKFFVGRNVVVILTRKIITKQEGRGVVFVTNVYAPAQAGAGRHYLLPWRMVSVLQSGVARLSAGLAAAAGIGGLSDGDFSADAGPQPFDGGKG